MGHIGVFTPLKGVQRPGKKIFVDSGHMEADDLHLMDGEGEDIDVDGDISDDSDVGLTEIKAQDFHFMLSVILDSCVVLQDHGMLWTFMHKKKACPAHLLFFVVMCRCDTEEADALCGKCKPRTRNIRHMCRQCHVPTMEASDHQARHPLKTQEQIEKMVRKQQLDRLKATSQHYLKNCWHRIRFNPTNSVGTHGSCPSEMPHALQLGIFRCVRDIFFDYIGKSAQVAFEINGLATMHGKLLSRQSDRTLPGTNFAKGIMEGKVMAKDFRGVLLIMAAVLRSTQGRSFLSTKSKFKQEHHKDDWLLLVELLLEWEAFLCQETMKVKHVKRLDRKHRHLMHVMKKVAQRTTGMGLNIMKFHAITHLMDDILAFGVPLEFDTAANESHHKPAKCAARLTQRNESTFQFQVAQRMFEFHILDLALHEMDTSERISDYFDEVSSASLSDMSTSHSNDPPSPISQPTSDESDEAPVILTDDTQMRVYVDEETI